MMDVKIEALRLEIATHMSNASYMADGFMPLFVASSHSKIVVIGQAPGIHAQTNGKVWDDASGARLMRWLGVTEKQFRDPLLFAHMPMDFYYPGKGKSGDAPPRKDFAPLWHKRLMDLMPNVVLIILIGQYAQAYYLPGKKRALTDVVREYRSYLPDYFPLVHPSPLNFRWHAKNEWFEKEVVPALQAAVAEILKI